VSLVGEEYANTKATGAAWKVQSIADYWRAIAQRPNGPIDPIPKIPSGPHAILLIFDDTGVQNESRPAKRKVLGKHFFTLKLWAMVILQL
jgi:hypothetical protein